MFGASIAAGHFHGNAYASLAIGAPQQPNGSGFGVLHIFKGSPNGLTPGEFIAGVDIGRDLVMGNVDSDFRDDVVAVEFTEIRVYFGGGGSITLPFGNPSSGRWVVVANFMGSYRDEIAILNGNDHNIRIVSGTGQVLQEIQLPRSQLFSSVALSAVKLGAGSYYDLIVGNGGEKVYDFQTAGKLWVYPGSTLGLGTLPTEWSLATQEVDLDPAVGDMFGSALPKLAAKH